MTYRYDPEHFTPWHDWYESVFEDAKRIGALMGWDIDDIAFSGFWSQGDGASFTGTLGYTKGCARAVREYTPSDTVLHDIAARWQALQKRCFYQLYGSVTRSHHRYSHEHTVSVECEDSRDSWRELPQGADDDAADIARDLMHWIYRQLEREYEYQVASNHAQAWCNAAQEAHDSLVSARAAVRDYRTGLRADLPDSALSTLKHAIGAALCDWRDACEEFETLCEVFHFYRDGRALDVLEFAREYM